MRASIAGLVLLLAFGTRAVFAQGGAPLTGSQISGFIASMADLEAWGDQHEDDLEALEEVWEPRIMDDIMNPFSAAATVIRSQPWAGEVTAIIRSHGFKNLESWARTGNRIFRAYLATQMDANRDQMEAGIEEAIRQIEAMDLPAEEKAKMLESVRASRQMSQAYDQVPEQDKKAITPFLGQLENMGREDEREEYDED